jgi:CDGSH-type Zn-finger protein
MATQPDGERHAERSAEPVVEIHVRPDGSYKVYGPVRVLDVDGNAYDLSGRRKTDRIGERIKLCRCGASRTMPFCDDSHIETGFSSQPRVTDPP